MATRRQQITAAAYLDRAGRRSRITQEMLAKRFGVTQAAIAHRLAGFKKSLTVDQLQRYQSFLKLPTRRRVTPIQLSMIQNV